MPELSTLLVFAAASLALIAIPGPNLIYIATRSVAEGPRAGLASALGVETGTLVHVTAAAVGLSALIASSATAFTTLKYAGVAYLFYLGVRALLRDEPLLPDDGAAAAETSLARAYAEGVLVNVLNPKVALFFLAFLPQFVDPARGAAAGQVLVLGIVLFALGLALDVLYALAAGVIGGWLRRRPRFLRRQRFLSGGVYITLGAAAALAGGEHRRG